MADCLFCRIIQGEIPAEIVYQDEWALAFRDIHPLAPVHILIIPKKHLANPHDLTEDEEGAMMAGRLVLAAKKIAEKEGLAENGYKLLLRVGSHGGQEVPHLHWHLIGGAPLKEIIGPVGKN